MTSDNAVKETQTARGLSPRAYALGFGLPWLLFTGFFFIKFFYVSPPTWEIVLSAVVFGVFLAAYLYAFRNYERPSRLRTPSFLILALGVGMAPLNAGANVFFSYPAWFLGRAYSTRTSVAVTAGIAGLVVLVTGLFELDLNFFLPAFLLSLGLGLMSAATRRVETTQHALMQSRAEAENLARIAERERIARDLHDTVGHSLSVIALKSDLAAQLASDTAPDAAEEMRAVNTVARQSLAEIRATLSGYWELSLDAELDGLRSSLEQAGIGAAIDVTATDLGPHVETALAMCCREAVTNVIRHSEASECEVAVASDGRSATARIADNGIGMTGEAGNGLKGMQQRVEQMGGSMRIGAGTGTVVDVSFPIEH